ERHGKTAIITWNEAQADLDWEFRPVLAPAREIHSTPHRAGARLGEVVSPVSTMNSLDAVGNEDFQGLLLQLVQGVTEHHGRPDVGDDDLAVSVHGDDALRRRFEEGTHDPVAPLELGRHASLVRGVARHGLDLANPPLVV